MSDGSHTIRLAVAGDAMLGRGVAQELEQDPGHRLFSDDLLAVAREADLFVLNLECCVSERGAPWPDPRKPFFFRAPPHALEALAELGVDCVTLANNHALDFGAGALADTLDHLDAAGIGRVGAGRELEEARKGRVVEARGFRVRVVGASDHPRDYAAGPGRPGIAHADLTTHRLPDWLREAAAPGPDSDAVLVTPHWGPNMVRTPVPHVRRAATALVDAGATLVAGHSAHVPHGVADPVLFDLGGLIDDYRVDPRLRNDLGLLFVVTLGRSGPRRIEAIPLRLEYSHTRLAQGADLEWMARRLQSACSALGTSVSREDGRLVVTPRVAAR